MLALLWQVLAISHILCLSSITMAEAISSGTNAQPHEPHSKMKLRYLRQRMHLASASQNGDDVSNNVQTKPEQLQVQAKPQQFSDSQIGVVSSLTKPESRSVDHSFSSHYTYTSSSDKDLPGNNVVTSLPASVNLQSHKTFGTESKQQRYFRNVAILHQQDVDTVESASDGFRVPWTLPTVESLLQPFVQATMMSDHTVEQIWKQVTQTYNKHLSASGVTVYILNFEAKLIILEQIEKFIVQYFSPTARTDEHFMMKRYLKQYLMAAEHIDLFIEESDMFGNFDPHHNRTTEESKIAFIHYYLFCRYISKRLSIDDQIPLQYEAAYLNVVASDTSWFGTTVYTSKKSIKKSVDDFVSFEMVFYKYPQFSIFSPYSTSFTSNIEVCQAWWKRELEIKTDLISVDWKTLNYLQKTLQAIEDVYLQQNVKTRTNHYISAIIKNMNVYSIHESFEQNIVDKYNEFNMYVDFELLKRYQTYPIELIVWRKLVKARKTTLTRGILIHGMDQSNANFLVDHLSIHVLFEHVKQELGTTTRIPLFDERIAILDDILKVCDMEFNYLADFEIDTTSCHDMMKKTTAYVIEMTTQVYEIMNGVESIAHQLDLGSEASVTPYLRIMSFFIRKLSLLQKPHVVSFPIKNHIVQQAFTLLSTGKKHRLDAFKNFEKDVHSWEELMSVNVSDSSSDEENPIS